ncbi:MAG: GAF domain-containing protein [Anaerolineales bacterium]|nr:GAF domain-containing protein [Anaerolineales bacterium]
MNYESFLEERKPGHLLFGQARMALLDVKAGYWGLRRQLEVFVGPRQRDLVLKQAGVNGGASFARSFVGSQPTDPKQALRDCLAAYQAAGFGQLTIQEMEFPFSNEEGHILIQADDTFEAWAAIENNEIKHGPVCAYTAGVLVGFVNVLDKRRDVVCIERTCLANGGDHCTFELLSADNAEEQTEISLTPDPGLGKQINLLELLFDRMPMGIAIIDPNYDIQRYNPTWSEFAEKYGHPSGKKLSPGVNYFTHLPGSEPDIKPLFDRVLSGETIRKENQPLHTHDQTTYWDVVLAPIMEKGKATGILNVTIDVTERAKSRRELQETLQALQVREERLSLVMEGINDGIWDWHIPSDNVYYSPRWKSMLGYEDQDLPNRFETWKELVHPEDREIALETIQEYIAGERSTYRLEHRLKHKNGSYRWILARGQVIRNEQGHPVRLVGSHTDITERKVVEKALKESEASLRSLIENARNFAVYQVEVQEEDPYGGRVVFVSPSLHDIFGIEEIYQFEKWFEHIHPDDKSRIERANRRAVQEGKAYSERTRWFHPKKEEWIWVHTASSPVFEEGKLTHFNGMIVDITEQKRAEAALDRHARFEALIAEISTRFINLAPNEIDQGINRALGDVCQFLDVDRGYVFRYSSDRKFMNNTHEWSREGIEPYVDRMQNISVEDLSWSNEVLMRGEILSIPDVDTLPPQAAAEKEEFQYQNIQSLLAAPMVYRGETMGFIGFDAVRSRREWDEESFQHLEVLSAIITNALEHMRYQAIQAGQRQFLELLASGKDFSETLETLIRLIENQWPGMMALVLKLDPDGKHLHVGASVSLPQEYVDSLEGLEIGPDVGSCGTASYHGERVIVEDIQTDSRWDSLRDLAVEHGLRACWSEPVISSDGEVIGTFAMYYQHQRSPTPEELHTIEIGAHLVGVAMEQRRSQKALQESQRTLSTLMSNLPGMAYRCLNNRDWTMEFVSEGSLALTGYQPGELIGNKVIAYGDLLHPEDKDRVWESTQAALEAKEPFQINYRILVGEEEKWVWEQGQGVYSNSGELQALEGFVTDITERVTARQNLESRVEERTHELSTLLDISHNLASTLDLDSLLDQILDQLSNVIEYDAASIMVLENETLNIQAYRGPIPLEKAHQMAFHLTEAKANQEVIARKEPVIVGDIRGDGWLAQAVRDTAAGELNTTFEYLRCWMGVPLIVKEEIVGMLTLDHHVPGYYSWSHAELTMAFANQAAVAIENASLYQETERRAEESEALFSVQQAITSRLELDEVLQMISDEARRLTNTDISAVYLLEGDELEIAYVSGDVPDSMLGYRLDMDESIAGEVIKNREAILVQDTWSDPRVDRAAADQAQARSLLIVPLVSSEKPMGTITVANRSPGGFNAEDKRLLTSLAANAVISVENARLYQAEQDRRLVAEGLRDILAILNSDMALDEILDHMIDQASRMLESQSGVIYHIDQDQDLIEIEAAHNMPNEFLEIGSFPLFDTGPNRAVLDGKPFVVPDIQARMANLDMDRIPKNRVVQVWQSTISEHFHSYLSVPLMIKEDVYGALSLFYAQQHEFSNEDIDLVVTLADQAALAIENAQLRTKAQESAVAAERDRIARDLHDAVTQTLFSTSLIAEVLPRIWENDPQQGLQRLDEIRTLTRGALAEMRNLLVELRPSALIDTDFPDLLQQLTEAFAGRSGIPIDLEIQGDCRLSPDSKVAAYRITQEALNNVSKHANATRCRVSSRCTDDRITLKISDDGSGFDPENTPPDSLGVRIMKERADEIGAALDIHSEPEKGTEVVVTWTRTKEK